MEKKTPTHRKQHQAPGRKPPQKIDRPRTVRVDPETWDIAMAHAVRLSSERGYIVTLKESLGDIAREHQKREDKKRGKNKTTPDKDADREV